MRTLLASAFLLASAATYAAGYTPPQLHGIGNDHANACVNGGGMQDGIVIPDCSGQRLPSDSYSATDSQLHMLPSPSPAIGIGGAWTQVPVTSYGVPSTASYALMSTTNGCHGNYDSIIAALGPNPTAATPQINVAGFGAGGRDGVGGEGGGQAFVPIFSGSAWLAAGSTCDGVSVQVIGYE